MRQGNGGEANKPSFPASHYGGIMDFFEAWALLRQGKKVRRSCWGGPYLELRGNLIVRVEFMFPSVAANLNYEELTATDWMVIPE